MPHWPTLRGRRRSGDRVAPRAALRRVAWKIWVAALSPIRPLVLGLSSCWSGWPL